MPKIPTIAEERLANVQPGRLDEDFMSRLIASADGSLTELTEEEIRFEAYLKIIAPCRLSRSAQATLLELVAETPFHVDEKIVLFHKSNTRKATTAAGSRRLHLATAAAVALLGALTALVTPSNAPEDTASNSPTHVSTARVSPVSNAFSPAGFNRNLKNTRDEGVIWSNPQGPHRVLRFTYMDQVTLRNENGDLIQVEQPREELVIIPEKVD